MKHSVHDVALGRWPAILSHFGLSSQVLSGRHGPCPVCGGRDRFRFDDKGGRGTFYCSHCGAGTGIDLLMKFKGWDFRTAAQEVEQVAGVMPRGSVFNPHPDSKKQKASRHVWLASKPLQAGDQAMRYLAERGLVIHQAPAELRLHQELTYWEGEKPLGKFTAMVARVTGPDGAALTVHRTYLKDGTKAPVPSPRKLMAGQPISGGAVRLFPVAAHIGIAEGIETALAAAELFGLPVWSCISARGIESFKPPAGVRRITIFADNDLNFAGQLAAYGAAYRLNQSGYSVDIKIPDKPGDWLNKLQELSVKTEKEQ